MRGEEGGSMFGEEGGDAEGIVGDRRGCGRIYSRERRQPILCGPKVLPPRAPSLFAPQNPRNLTLMITNYNNLESPHVAREGIPDPPLSPPLPSFGSLGERPLRSPCEGFGHIPHLSQSSNPLHASV